jgi:hypothetical protein
MTTPHEELEPWRSGWSCKEFLKTWDARVGSVGALLELRHANLWRVDSYSVDEWGVKINVSYLPMPGFKPARNDRAELSSAWEMFHIDEGRWQARYCWKFLLGDHEIESVIAAGAQAASLGLLLTDSHVLAIFRWRSSLESREKENPGNTDFPAFLDSLFNPPPPPERPASETKS